MTKNSLQPQDKYVLRLPDGMRERLKSAAKANGRSLNAEIIHRLEGGIEKDESGRLSVWLPGELLERVFEEAEWRRCSLEDVVVEAVESAFPYVPTVEEYIDRLRMEIEKDGKMKSEDADRYLRTTQEFLASNPGVAARRVRLPLRPVTSEDGE